MNIKLNDEERSALRGARNITKVAYIFCFRWAMNFSTGIAGLPPRRINWFDVWQEIEELPDRGSTLRPPSLTTQQKQKKIRGIVEECIRRGVLKPIEENGKRLPMVFGCILASRNNPSAGGTASERREQRRDFSNKNSVNSTHSDEILQGERQPLKRKSGTYQESGNNIYLNNICSTVRDRSTTLQERNLSRSSNANLSARKISQPSLKAIPENFVVTERHRRFAAEQQTPNPDEVVVKFIKYYQSSGKHSADWDACFEKFLLTEKEFQQQGNFYANQKRAFNAGEKQYGRKKPTGLDLLAEEFEQKYGEPSWN